MKLEKTVTNRGFALYKGKDRNDKDFTLQKSSIATEDAIWLGVMDAEPKMLVPNMGWVEVPMHEGVEFNTRMHLTKEQVEELLPILKKFVETGEL